MRPISHLIMGVLLFCEASVAFAQNRDSVVKAFADLSSIANEMSQDSIYSEMNKEVRKQLPFRGTKNYYPTQLNGLSNAVAEKYGEYNGPLNDLS